MRFVDELYTFYRDQFTGSEFDAEIIAAAILDDLERVDVLWLLGELEDEELYGLLGFYLVENLKTKMAKDGYIERDTRLH